MKKRNIISLFTVLLLVAHAWAGHGAKSWLRKESSWFGGEEAKTVATNILSWQSDLGGWPKNMDTTAKPFDGDRSALEPTFDNGATTDELQLLARIYRETHAERYRSAVERGVDYILQAQYPNGGWPQFYPPGSQYHRYITFNDNAMVRLMEFLRDAQQFEFLDTGRREAARRSFNRGIECILKSQVIVNGTPTVWCAQHDEVTLEPRPARAFELESLSGAESVGIVRLLMSLAKPSPEVVRAVNAALAWFESAKLTGIRVDVVNGDKVVVPDANVRPLWARFYEIGTNRPFFCGRDGVRQYSLSEIDAERRNGYAWYGNWPDRLIQEDYPRWKKALGQAEPAANGAKLRVVLVGDSTVANGSGWGDAFGKMLSSDVSCENMARGGQSSLSFYDSGLWQNALQSKPDYLFIQFGHNDSPGKGPSRETDPETTFRANMIRYVEEARANGSQPVLVTSMARRQFDKDGKFARSGSLERVMIPYVEVVKSIAREMKVPLIDLHTRSIELYDKLGKEGCEKQLSPYNAEKGNYDGTHFTENGGALMAELVAEDLRKAVPSLASCLK